MKYKVHRIGLLLRMIILCTTENQATIQNQFNLIFIPTPLFSVPQ